MRGTAEFSALSEDLRRVLEDSGTWQTLQAGEQLFAFGDAGDSMYVVAEGELQSLVPGKNAQEIVISELGPNSIIGEAQALHGGKRTSTVRAKTDARLLRFEKVAFARLGGGAGDALDQLNTMILRRLRRTQLAVILAGYLGPLTREQLQAIELLADWITLPQGAELFKQGDDADAVFILVSGSLGVVVPGADGADVVRGRVHAGELVGEMAILTGEPRSATVYAIRDAELVRFSTGEFESILDKHPAFLREIARTNIARLRNARSFTQAKETTVLSVVAAPGAPLDEFVRELARELEPYTSVLHLNAAKVDDELEMPGVAQSPRRHALATRFAAWMSELEEKHEVIVLEADTGATNWTQRCVQQSDQVIILGQGGETPSLGDLEPLLDAQQGLASVPKRLVLMHPADRERPSGTSAWLDRWPVDMPHHIRRGNQPDYQRLARFLTGRAVGVALGGGGARGFAHIGAFRALREAGIPVDIVGGTSMGAVIGAEFALGMQHDEMLAANRVMFRNLGLLMDVTLPLLSFTSGKAYATTLEETFGDVAIEDLWTPFFCVSSNISRAKMALHRRGMLRQKVRASSGVQGLFPPMVMDGDLHVDGALFSNLPADVMKSVCQGTVIAVDVTPPVDLAENSEYGDTISGWTVLWKRLRGGPEKFHSSDLGTIMQRSAEAASMANQKRVIATMVDYYIRMPVAQVHLMNFGAIDRLYQLGYETAKARVIEWEQSTKDSGPLLPWRH